MLAFLRTLFAMSGLLAAVVLLYTVRKVVVLNYLWAAACAIVYFAFGIYYDDISMLMIIVAAAWAAYLLGWAALIVLIPLMVLARIWALLVGPLEKLNKEDV